MKHRAAESLALVLFAILVIATTFLHEPWRDEADSWLLARDASLREIIELMPYAGTPALWYAVLYPFAKAGMPFLTQSLINNALMIAAAAVVLFFSPLPRAANIALIFNYYALFEYGVVARSYGLSVLLLVCALALWRSSRPIMLAIVLGLAANTNAHSLLLSLVLAGTWLIVASLSGKPGREVSADLPKQVSRNQLPIASAIYLLLAGLAIWQIRPPADGNLAHLGRPVLPEYAPEALSEAFFPFVPVTVGAALGLLALAAVSAAVIRNRASLFVLWASTAGLTMLFVFVWVGGRRHYGFIALAAFAAAWIGRPERWPRWSAIALAASMTWSLLAGVWMTWREWREPFSGAREVAEFIHRNGLAELEIAGHPAPQAGAILPYMKGKKIWYAGIADWGTYQKWDRRFEMGQRVTYPEAVARMKQRFAGEAFLLLLNVEIPTPSAVGLRLLFRNERVPFGRADEQYWLYTQDGMVVSSRLP